MGVARLTGLALAGVAVGVVGGWADQKPPPAGAGVRTRMETLHQHGGLPPGWRFALPGGDPRAGREVFAKLECYKCHEVKGEHFHGAPRQLGESGPELSGMGGHHPSEYFAESILNPNAVIVTGPGYTGPDGRSIMPDYRDSLTAAELIDLVAYLKSLAGGATAGHQHADAAPREQVVGSYRVRVDYTSHAHGSQARGHLMVFIADVQSGEPIPYLPVTATVRAGKRPPRSVRLAPMIGEQGFHYGADLNLPESTSRIRIVIGPPAVRVMSSAGGRFAKSETVSFEWTP